jgi:hypothetical protein
MTREFVTYNQALALKELGFDEPCMAIYYSKDKSFSWHHHIDHTNKEPVLDTGEFNISAPTYSAAFRWFREKHNLYAEICLDSYKEPYSLKVTIKHLDDTNTFVDKEYYPYSNGIGAIDNKKYEEAEQACLDKLIEICKTKNNEQAN